MHDSLRQAALACKMDSEAAFCCACLPDRQARAARLSEGAEEKKFIRYHPRGQGSLSQEDLCTILDACDPERILSPAEWLERLGRGALGEGDLCLTFDDGLLCQVDIALPVLEERGLRAFWFVYSSVFTGQWENMEIFRVFRDSFPDIAEFYQLFFRAANADVPEQEVAALRKKFPFYSDSDARYRILRDQVLGKRRYEEVMDAMIAESDMEKTALAKNLWMTDEHLHSLHRAGHVIGLHSFSHPTVMVALSRGEQREEYVRNAAHIARVTGAQPVSMAHPCDSYNGEMLAILRSLGVVCGFRSHMQPSPDGVPNPSALELAREDAATILRALSR